MSAHPYRSLPESSFWRKAVARPQASDVDPVTSFTLKIDRETKVATAGSCFAQHIARHLAACGFNYFVPEPGHGILPEAVRKSHGYGLFSCRYGNIYTARQLWQLFERAFERFEPREDSWSKGPDVWLDPFRPTGVEGGTFDPEQHEFYNQPLEDIIDDLVRLREALAEINPSAAILLTVSPVPLVATADPLQHVLTATTYSKSVLRVAADIMRRRFDNVHYFPSFEIVTGAHARGRYFADDLRNVLEPGVEHVMRLFMKHASGSAVGHEARPKPDLKEDDYLKEAEQLVQVECDEIALERE
jgi:hypothetical protein